MKKIIGALIAALVLGVLSFAQETIPDPSDIGVDSAQQKLQEISINKFEDPGFWKVTMPDDHGVVTYRRIEGAPADKKPIASEAATETQGNDQYVLAIRADYFRRVNTQIAVVPDRPLAVPGITKTISMWVIGRNFNHILKIVVENDFGQQAILPMGRLNFTGWKQLTVAVPPTFEQRNPHYQDKSGLKITALLIQPELAETYGSYYVYFDDLRVWTDLFAEETRDPDDLPDSW